MPKKPRRKLTEADQTELFEEIDGKAVLPAAEDEEPQEKKGKAKKAQPEPEEDIGKGTGFLFDMLEEEPEHSPEAEKSSSEGEKKLEFQPEDATAELAEPASEPKNEDSLEEAEQLAQNLMREDASDMKEELQEVADEVEEAELVPAPAQPRGSDIVEEALKHADTDCDELTLAYFASRAYLEYAISVVKGRALPDVCDGMKPVQRRILYAMKRLGLNPDVKTVKSARVVGEVLGKYHPHGDSPAYDAMVRLAQDFTMRYPLVQGQGNFGSADGDGAAAMRYTEVRLSKYADLLLGELDKGTVKFIPNYDGTHKEPVLLPARLPVLLLNGSSGIAVGMATEIPSHNLTEVGEAAIEVIRNPEITTDELLEIVKGPDFPGGAQVISSASDIKNVYRSGYGNLQVRATYHFEELSRGQWQLVFDSVPYKVSVMKVMSELEALTNPKAPQGKKSLTAKQQQDKQLIMNVMSGMRDESSAEAPVRLVIDPKSKSIDREELVSTILSKTSLETSCKFNLVVIGIDGKPRQKGLKDILSEWVSFRLRTVRARSQTSLNEAEARIHTLEGRLIVLVDIEEVIRIIRGADDPKKELITHFGLSDTQAEDILEIKLRQLASLDEVKLRKELEKLRNEAERLRGLLTDEKKLRREVTKEIRQDIDTYGDERRTLIEEAKGASIAKQVIDEPVTVIVSEKGFLRSRQGHGFDARAMNFKLGDKYRCSMECRSVDNLYILSNTGRIYSIPVSSLPSARGEGTHVSAFVQFQDGDVPFDYICGASDTVLLFTSDAAMGFFCKMSDLAVRQRGGKSFFILDGAKPLPVQVSTPLTGWIAALSSSGRLVVFTTDELRALSSGGKGTTIMALQDDEKLVAAVPISPNGVVVVGKGRGGKIQELLVGPRSIEDYRTRRGRKGRFVEAKWEFLGLKPYKLETANKGDDSEEVEESTII
ncbi:MAG TPA: DNA topoisomerase IV subunit A [Parasutterella excrementihominis]|uniref:DNA topoisomerase IV subunit A n=1 Tax=Parasutterella excrementihominis TaxID=487175 RepID=UPI000ECD1F7C|nr:DNA topoisomerase IV subunit A [Parasutterella excrementihominis]HAI61674.1 DNA topoisomerase IV subunit A [Parasutterella excrementihominis]